ncbi:MAG: glycosyltransferase family 2 protein [Opitutaceae bacterium]|nr:glycosyltransferase family 2 protein [Opitutaceae bacterium]
MYRNKRVAVVMPAYNAERTLRATYDEVVDQGIVDDIILVDDRSRDGTVALARSLPGVTVHVHDRNLGYGGNQKSCYRIALEKGAHIVIMVHPDYQYTPKLIPAMASMIANGLHDFVVGSRILGGFALQGGMPWWKYIANRFLTAAQNLLMGAKLSEYHTGYRAYSRELLLKMKLDILSNDFIFDNQFIAQALWNGSMIGEVSCPTKYFPEASSINFHRSLVYGIGCMKISLQFFLARRLGFARPDFLAADPP